MDYRTLCLDFVLRNCLNARPEPGIKGAVTRFRNMEMRTGFFQFVSAVVGLSLGVGVMTATVLLGVAALLQ
jgi:hypothetical protein